MGTKSKNVLRTEQKAPKKTETAKLMEAVKTATSLINPKIAAQISAAPKTVEVPKTAPTPAISGFRPAKFALNAQIKVISTANPKRPGTKAAAKWPLYNGCKTVGDVIKAFVAAGWPKRRALSALRWDSGHGFIEITEASAAQPAPKSGKAA